MVPLNFNETTWIERLATALEQVAANAQPSYSPLPPDLPRYGLIEVYESILHRGYRDLAARAKFDPAAAVQFKESHIWVDGHPAEAVAILKEHPLIETVLESTGTDEWIWLDTLTKRHRTELKRLVSCLAKLSVKEGGDEAAQRLHRYLTAGANGTLPAFEITVIHGLAVKTRLDLDVGAYLAPYGDVRAEFDLPDEPEPLSKTSYPEAAVLVRTFEYGPGVAPPGDHAGLPDVQVSYRFPTSYQVDLKGWWADSKLLVDLLSIAMRVPLLSRTRYVRVAKWVGKIDPNLAFGTQESRGFVPNMWPKGHDLSEGVLEAFLELACGLQGHPDKRDAMLLAIGRLAGSFSRRGSRFGQEDPILDVAIALEVLYGGETGHRLAQRAAALLGVTATEQKQTYDQARAFYDLRTRIVHWEEPHPSPDILQRELDAGRNLACLTLVGLLNRDAPLQWAGVMKGLLAETQAYIATKRRQQE